MANMNLFTGSLSFEKLQRMAQAFDGLRERAGIVLQIESKAEIPDPVDWCKDVSGHDLDSWQVSLLYTTATRVLLNCSRQVGKTEIVSLKAAYRARYLGKKVLVLAPSLYQSSKVRVRAERFLTNGGATFVTKNATTLELDNGGSVISLPGDRPDLSARGETTDDLIVDEASRVRTELITAAAPTTATKPDATETYLSTPAGKQGEFYRAWTEDHDWLKVEVPATECSRISKVFLDRMRGRLGVMFAQEFECQFLASSLAILDPDAINAMFNMPPDATNIAINWGEPTAKRINWS